MLIDNRIIWIYWKTVNNSYAYANRTVLVEPPRKIGSSITSVNKITSNTEEQSVLMSDVLSVSPTSPDWNKVLKSYWNSISQEVPKSGKKLEIGFMYDIDSFAKKKYIDIINRNIYSEKGKLVNDKDLNDYIDNKITAAIHVFNKSVIIANKLSNEKAKDSALTDAYFKKYAIIIAAESERYKVGTPINAFEYMLYRYCLVYRDVANEFSLKDKSNNIRFYLHSDIDIKKYKELKLQNERDRMNLYLKMIKSVSSVENTLYAMGFGNEIPSEDIDKFTMLDEKSKSDTSKFINIANNSHLETLGLIEKYIKYGIINRFEGSQIIVDGNDPTIIIGNNLDEVLSWFNNKSNNATVSEYSIRFKNLPK